MILIQDLHINKVVKMKILKILILQAFWYLSVLYGHLYQSPILIAAILLAVANFIVYKPQISRGHYTFTLFIFVTYGVFQEWLYKKIGLVDYGQDSFPLWLTSLYFVFITYYGDVFNYLSKKSSLLLFVLGAAGGLSAYYGGVKISPIEVLSPVYYFAIALSWGIFFPISFKIFYEGFIWNKILDASIYYSFDKRGYLRHEAKFDEKYNFISGAHALITGGTSGIGQAASLELSKQGVLVQVTGRSINKGNSAVASHEGISFIPWDMSNWEQIDSIVDSTPLLDYVVLNAGGMPQNYEKNKASVELQFASQLFGHYYLIKKLKIKNKLKKDARIVWVTSGGMYLSKLNLETIFDNPNYDKVTTYANVKRAQVTLLPHLKEEFCDQTVTAMHPGWAATPGVSNSIPEFDKKMQGRLRSPLQGADTILWLLGTKKEVISGGFYFDRKKVKTNLIWFTRPTNKQRIKLIELLNRFL
jgi:dehydrogenase/reductase SDR family member 12